MKDMRSDEARRAVVERLQQLAAAVGSGRARVLSAEQNRRIGCDMLWRESDMRIAEPNDETTIVLRVEPREELARIDYLHREIALLLTRMIPLLPHLPAMRWPLAEMASDLPSSPAYDVLKHALGAVED